MIATKTNSRHKKTWNSSSSLASLILAKLSRRVWKTKSVHPPFFLLFRHFTFRSLSCLEEDSPLQAEWWHGLDSFNFLKIVTHLSSGRLLPPPVTFLAVSFHNCPGRLTNLIRLKANPLIKKNPNLFYGKSNFKTFKFSRRN